MAINYIERASKQANEGERERDSKVYQTPLNNLEPMNEVELLFDFTWLLCEFEFNV